jgi:hypothetical protein
VIGDKQLILGFDDQLFNDNDEVLVPFVASPHRAASKEFTHGAASASKSLCKQSVAPLRSTTILGSLAVPLPEDAAATTTEAPAPVETSTKIATKRSSSGSKLSKKVDCLRSRHGSAEHLIHTQSTMD